MDIEEATIKRWVNSVTDEGFMPIHFASYKGNIVKYKSNTFSKG